jgi:uncharacterized protein (TIGR03000 family)
VVLVQQQAPAGYGPAPPGNRGTNGARDKDASVTARVTVRLPAQARLWVNDVPCPLTSDTRSFVTPTLQPGQKYAYTLRAQVEREGQRLTETRQVPVAAGRQVNVRFDFATVSTASR